MIRKTALALALAGLGAIGDARAEDLGAWTGPKIGAHTGTVIGDFFGTYNSQDDPISYEDAGGPQPILGMHLEYLYEFGFPLVIGPRLDFSHAFLDNEGPRGLNGDRISTKIDFFANAGLKVGTPIGRWMVYSIAGVAFASYQAEIFDAASGRDFALDEGNAAPFFGGGVEWRMDDSLSLFAEGIYYAFDDENFSPNTAPNADPTDRFALDSIAVVRVGLTYHF